MPRGVFGATEHAISLTDPVAMSFSSLLGDAGLGHASSVSTPCVVWPLEACLAPR